MQHIEGTKKLLVITPQVIMEIRAEAYGKEVSETADKIKSKLMDTETLEKDIKQEIIWKRSSLSLHNADSMPTFGNSGQINQTIKFLNDVLEELKRDKIKIPEGTNLIVAEKYYDESCLNREITISIRLDWSAKPEEEQKPNQRSCTVM